MAVVEQPPVPQLITEEEVRAIAAAEGLVLVPAPSSSTGYKGVTRTGCVGKPFKAQARQDGGKKNLGHYATAAEASLAYVRHLGPDLCTVEAWRATTTAIPAASSEPEHTAQQLAASEGLVLVPAPGTATGYKGVTRSGSGSKPFKVQVRQAGGLGKSVKRNLGCYGTAAEAALAYARHLRAAAATAATAALPAEPMPAAQPPAAAEQVYAAQILAGPLWVASLAAPAHAGPMHPVAPALVAPACAEPSRLAPPPAPDAPPPAQAAIAAPLRAELGHSLGAELTHVELAPAAALQAAPPLQAAAAEVVEASAMQEVWQEEAAAPMPEVVASPRGSDA
jgi:hypothetical protein